MKYTLKMLGALTLATMLAAPILADPPADKGKAANNYDDHRNDHDDGDREDHKGNGDDHHDKDKNGSNHGQVVSECNHRANDRHMKGQDRKQWVEWCEEHGARFKYENRSWSMDRSCYQKADDRNLSGDKRRSYVHDCLTKTDRTRYDYSKYNTTGEPRGKDALGKSK